jgi:hypothetical protein
MNGTEFKIATSLTIPSLIEGSIEKAGPQRVNILQKGQGARDPLR